MLDSYVEIDLDKIGANARAITQKYSDYKYFIAVLKGDGYGHGMEVANEMYKNGINYFAVSSLEEAQSFRKVNKDAPLLCLHPVHLSRIEEAKRLNLTIAVNELDYLKRLLDLNIDCNFKVHLQIDTGFNRLGFKDKNEVKTAVDMINGSNFVLEGIYQHFATAGIFDPHCQPLAWYGVTNLDIANLQEVAILYPSIADAAVLVVVKTCQARKSTTRVGLTIIHLLIAILQEGWCPRVIRWVHDRETHL